MKATSIKSLVVLFILGCIIATGHSVAKEGQSLLTERMLPDNAVKAEILARIKKGL